MDTGSAIPAPPRPEQPLNAAALLLGAALGLVALAELYAKREREHRREPLEPVLTARLEELSRSLMDTRAELTVERERRREVQTHAAEVAREHGARLDACRRELRRRGVSPQELAELEHGAIAVEQEHAET